MRAAINKENIIIRNPNSIRPYQHVLEPLFAYLLIAQKQYENKQFADSYNVGPNEKDCVTTGKIVELFVNKWGEGLKWECKEAKGPHEANYLKLDCSKIKKNINWEPVWNINKAIEKTVEFSKTYINRGNLEECIINQIKEYIESGKGENKNV